MKLMRLLVAAVFTTTAFATTAVAILFRHSFAEPG